MSISTSPKRSQETAILHKLWKVAASADNPIEIPCGSEKAAIRRRFTFYNAVAKVKETPALDPELHAAVENVMIFFKEGDKTTLCLGRKPAPDDLLEVAAGLGIDVTNLDGKDAIEAEAEASLRRMMAGQTQAFAPARTAPAEPSPPAFDYSQAAEPVALTPGKRVRAADLLYPPKKSEGQS